MIRLTISGFIAVLVIAICAYNIQPYPLVPEAIQYLASLFLGGLAGIGIFNLMGSLYATFDPDYDSKLP